MQKRNVTFSSWQISSLTTGGSGFTIRASDVHPDERGTTTVWEVRLTALGTLDSQSLKRWVELCLAAQLFVERAGLKDMEITVSAASQPKPEKGDADR